MPRMRISILQLIAIMTCFAILSPWWLKALPKDLVKQEKRPTTSQGITVQLPMLGTTDMGTVVSVPDGGVAMFGGGIVRRTKPRPTSIEKTFPQTLQKLAKIQLPILGTTKVNTTVSVPDGGKVLIGGRVTGTAYPTTAQVSSSSKIHQKKIQSGLINQNFPLASGILSGLILGLAIGFSFRSYRAD